MSQRDDDLATMGSNERRHRIDEIAETYLKSLHKTPGSMSWDEIVHQHPELAPDLERRLRFVASVFQALQPEPKADQPSTGDSTACSAPTQLASDKNGDGHSIPQDRVVSVRCPHCGNLLKIVAHDRVEITCNSCGSAVSVDPEGTKTDKRIRAPKFVGHFKILSVLGQGAFGVAYKAHDTRLSREVAIKIPRAGSFATANDELRFVREARHAAQLRHPNIVQVHEIANDHGVPYLVSDFIDGITLADLISGRRLSYRESAEMLITIAQAIQFAHENNVIHRDLKPSNILLDAQNKPYVADFGLARQAEGEFTVTLEGELLGTPAYMPPEQAAGKDVDVRADVYSLGVILYRLICGELPFRGSQRMMIHQVLHDDPKSPRRLDERVPRDLDTIILKAMAKERDRRYQTAMDFAQDLRRWLSSQPIDARPVGIFGKSIRWCRRNPKGVLAIAGASVLLLATAGLGLAWRDQAQQSRTARHQDLRRQIQMHNQNGISRMEVGDAFGSIPWFVEALGAGSKLADETKSKLEMDQLLLQRLRLGMLEQATPTLRQVWSPGGKIQDIHFSADGQVLLATSRNGAIQVLDPNRAEVDVLQSANNPEVAVSDLDSGGTRACTATAGNEAILWDVRSRKRLATLSHDGVILSVSFSPDGKWVATTGADHQAGVWDASNGKLVAKFQHPGEYVASATFSPDSQSLLTFSRLDPDSAGELRLWNIEKVELRTPMMTYPGYVFDAVFDRGGERIFAACDDGSAVIWNAITGEIVGEPLKQNNSLHRILLADDEQTLITCSFDGTVAFWDLKNRFRKENTIVTPYSVNDMDADPANDFVALAHDDNRVRIYWQFCGRQIGTDIPHGGHPLAIAFHPDGRRLAVGGDDGVVRLWDLAGLAPAHNAIRNQDGYTSLTYSKDGRRILVSGMEHSARQYDARTLAPLGDAMSHDDEVIYSEYDDQERYVVTAGSDQIAQIWDAVNSQPIGPPLKHASSVIRAKFIPNSDRLITATLDGAGAIWKIGSDQPIEEFKQDSRLVGLKIHPDGKSFALSGEGFFLQIRSALDGSPQGRSIQHNGPVFSAEYSPSGKQLLSVSGGGSIDVSNIEGEPKAAAHWDLGSSIFAASFVRDDATFMTGDSAGELIQWGKTAAGYSPNWSFIDPSSDFDRIVVHPSLPIVLAGRSPSGVSFQPRAGIVGIHDLTTGELLTSTMSHFRPIIRLILSPDGKQVATGSDDGTVRLWDLVSDDRPIEEMRRLANFYNGYSMDEQLQRHTMDAPTQSSEFQAIRQSDPARFDCTPDEIDRWNDEVQWLRAHRN